MGTVWMTVETIMCAGQKVAIRHSFSPSGNRCFCTQSRASNNQSHVKCTCRNTLLRTHLDSVIGAYVHRVSIGICLRFVARRAFRGSNIDAVLYLRKMCPLPQSCDAAALNSMFSYCGKVAKNAKLFHWFREYLAMNWDHCRWIRLRTSRALEPLDTPEC